MNLENKKIYIGMISAKNEGILQVCNTEGEIKAINNGANNIIQAAGIVAENMGKISDSASNVQFSAIRL